MVETSDDGILAEYMVSYWSMKHEKLDRPTKLLETLYITERYQAGENLREARSVYDHAVWNGVPASLSAIGLLPAFAASVAWPAICAAAAAGRI